MSKTTRPWGKCECGYAATSTTDFLRHLDAHDGVTRPVDWYKLGGSKRGYAQWDDSTSVMIHRNPQTGDVRYVGSHDAKLKPGYQREYLRSLREVERFERDNGVRSEMAWFDKGSGRGFDDHHNGVKVTH